MAIYAKDMHKNISDSIICYSPRHSPSRENTCVHKKEYCTAVKKDGPQLYATLWIICTNCIERNLSQRVYDFTNVEFKINQINPGAGNKEGDRRALTWRCLGGSGNSGDSLFSDPGMFV